MLGTIMDVLSEDFKSSDAMSVDTKRGNRIPPSAPVLNLTIFLIFFSDLRPTSFKTLSFDTIQSKHRFNSRTPHSLVYFLIINSKVESSKRICLGLKQY